MHWFLRHATHVHHHRNITICYTGSVNLILRLRQLVGLSQSELADQLGVSQPAVSQYESGRRSPNLDAFVDVASRFARRALIVPDRITPSHDRSERFSRLLHMRVAEHLLLDGDRVRRIAHENLDRFGDLMPDPYSNEWHRLLEPTNDTELLSVLCIPDREMTGLLSSSPFAGVVSEDERRYLLERSRAA